MRGGEEERERERDRSFLNILVCTKTKYSLPEMILGVAGIDGAPEAPQLVFFFFVESVVVMWLQLIAGSHICRSLSETLPGIRCELQAM